MYACVWYVQNPIGAVGCQHLKELRQLRSLSIDEIGTDGCRNLKELMQLTSLSIGRQNNIGVDGCRHLKELQQLTSLSIGDQNFIGVGGCGDLFDWPLSRLPLCSCSILCTLRRSSSPIDP